MQWTRHRSSNVVRLHLMVLLSLVIGVAFLPAPVVKAGSYHTGIIADGIISPGEWQANELVATEVEDDLNLNTITPTLTSDLDQLWVSWDSQTLYLRIDGNFSPGNTPTDNRGFAAFLDINYGTQITNTGVSGLSTLNDLAITTNNSFNKFLSAPAWIENLAAFKADYAIGSVNNVTVTRNMTHTAAGLRSWGGDGNPTQGYITATTALSGVDVSISSNSTTTVGIITKTNTISVAEMSIPWNVLFANQPAGKILPGAKLAVVVMHARITSLGQATIGFETLPTSGAGTATLGNLNNSSHFYIVELDSNSDGYVDVGVKTGNEATTWPSNSVATPSRPNAATTYSAAKVINGNLDDWHQNEFIGAGRNDTGVESTMRYHTSWDAHNLYVAFAGNGTLNGPSANRFNVAIDVDPPCYPDNDGDMGEIFGVVFNNDSEPDFVYQWDANADTSKVYTPVGTNWSSGVANGNGVDSNTNNGIVELSIPRSTLGSLGYGATFYYWMSDGSNTDVDAYGNTPIAANTNMLTTFSRWNQLTTGVNIATSESDTCNLPSEVGITQHPQAIGDLLPGQPITYTLTFSNSGLGVASGVVITDILPADVVYDGFSSNNPLLTKVGDHVWTLASFLPAGNATLSIYGHISPLVNTNRTLTNTVQISANNDASATNNSHSANATVIPPLISLTSSLYAYHESDGLVWLTATLNSPNPYAPVTIDYAMLDDTAIAGSDYTDVRPTDVAPTEVIPAGALSVAIDAVLEDDIDNELDESFLLTILNPVGAVLAMPMTSTVTIIDNDEPPSLFIDSVIRDEDAGALPFRVWLSKSASKPITGTLSTLNNTAIAGVDFVALDNEPFLISSGMTQTVVYVNLMDDSIDELPETFELTLTNLFDANVGHGLGESWATGTISDDDELPAITISDLTVNEGVGNGTLQISLSAPYPSVITATIVTLNNSAITPADYGSINTVVSIPANTTIYTLALPIVNDAIDELNETLTVSILSASMPILDGTAIVTIEDNDNSPILTVAGATVSESVGSLVFQITLNAPSGLTVSGVLNTSNGSAKTPADYEAIINQPFTIGAGSTAITVAVQISDDTLYEINENLGLTASNVNNAIVQGASNYASGVIANDDSLPQLTINDVSVLETGVMQMQVNLSAASGVNVDGYITTTNGSATAGADFVGLANSQFIIPIGNTSIVVQINLNNDLTDEINETLTVNVGNVSNAVVVDGTAIGTILDDDAPSAITVNDAFVNEGSSAAVTLTLNIASSLPITGVLNSTNGNATAGSDYAQQVNLPFTIPAGNTSTVISLPTTEDLLDEHNETLTLVASNVTNATLADNSGTITINDNDDMPHLTITGATVAEAAGMTTMQLSLNAPSGRTINGRITTLAGTATSADYGLMSLVPFTIPAGITQVPITITIVNDSMDEENEVFSGLMGNINFANVTTFAADIVITDDDAPPALNIMDANASESLGQMNFTLNLSAASGRVITGLLQTTSQSAIAPNDFVAQNMVPFTITPDSPSLIVSVPIVDDTLDENQETFLATISGVARATLVDDSAVGTIADDDVMPVASFADVVVNEADGAANFIVTLSRASGLDVSGFLSTLPDSAASPEDFETFNSVPFTVPAGSTSLIVPIAVVSDTLDEIDETFYIVINNLVHATSLDVSMFGTIVDDDISPGLVIADAVVDENRSIMYFTVTLSTASGLDISGVVNTTDDSAIAPDDYSAQSDTSFTLFAGNNQMRVAVPIADDRIDELNETFTITISGVDFAQISDGTAIGTILDNDAPPKLNILNAIAHEHEGQMIFNLNLTAPSILSVQGTLNTAGTTAMGNIDYVEQSNVPFVFPVGSTQITVAVPLLNDTSLESVEFFNVNLSNVLYADVVNGGALGTLYDDDSTGTGTLVIVLENQPKGTQNVRFTPNFTTSFYLDDENNGAQTDTYTKTRSFTLSPGIYTVTETVPYSYHLMNVSCTPNGSGVHLVKSARITVLGSGQTITCTFINHRGVTIRTHAYNDLNNNNAYNYPDSAVANVTFNTFVPISTTALYSATGKTTGKVSWSYILPGEYTVCAMSWPSTFIQPFQPASLSPTLGKPCYTLNLPPGATATAYFGFRNGSVVNAAEIAIDEASNESLMQGIVYEMLPDVPDDTGGYEEVVPVVEEQDVPQGTEESEETIATLRFVYLPVVSR